MKIKIKLVLKIRHQKDFESQQIILLRVQTIILQCPHQVKVYDVFQEYCLRRTNNFGLIFPTWNIPFVSNSYFTFLNKENRTDCKVKFNHNMHD